MNRPRYRYELRQGGVTIESGHLAEISDFRVGDPVNVNGLVGTVRAVETDAGEAAATLIIELRPGQSW